MPDDLGVKTVRGVSWVGLSQGAVYLIHLACLGLSARYLGGAEFGVEAAAVTIVGVLGIVAHLGLGQALVQRRGLLAQHLSAGFWLGVAAAGLSLGLLIAAAPVWGRLFFSDPGRVTAILRPMGWVLVCTGVGVVPRSQMERAFRFRELALVELCAAGLAGGTLVFLASKGLGLWALVWYHLVRNTVSAGVPWVLRPIRVSVPFALSHVKELLGFGGSWMGAQLISFFQHNLDYVFVGRRLGEGPLGYYALAYRLIAFPQTRILQAVSRATFPAFSVLQTDRERLGRAYLTTLRYVALVVFPVMTGFVLLADPGVVLLYGAEKLPAVRLLQIMSPGGAARAVGAAVGLVWLGLGRTGVTLAWSSGAGVAVLGAVWAGVAWGAEGVALAVSASSVLLTLVSQGITNRMVRLRFAETFAALAPALACSLAFGATVWTLRYAAAGTVSGLPLVLACAALGGLAAILAVYLGAQGTWQEAKAIVRGGVGASPEGTGWEAPRRTP